MSEFSHSASYIPDQLRDNLSFLSTQLLDRSSLLSSLSSASSLIHSLEFERDQIAHQHALLLSSSCLIPTQISVISSTISETQSQLAAEQLANEALSAKVSSTRSTPDLSIKDLKRLRKQIASKEAVAAKLREEITESRQRRGRTEGEIKEVEEEVKAIVERGSSGGNGGSGEEENRRIRAQIMRWEKKLVRIGEVIDKYRRVAHKRPKLQPSEPITATETPSNPPITDVVLPETHSKQPTTDALVPETLSKLPLPDAGLHQHYTKPCPEPTISVKSSPSTIASPSVLNSPPYSPLYSPPVLPLFRPPPKLAKPIFEKYCISDDPKDQCFVPKPVIAEETDYLSLKRDIKFAFEMYKAQTECPKEHVDILAMSFRKAQHREAAVSLTLRSISASSKSFSDSDAFYLLRALFSPCDPPSFSTLTSYAISDFYRSRKCEGVRHQWSSEPPGQSTLQGLWLLTAVKVAIENGWAEGLKTLGRLLFAHSNFEMLQYVVTLIEPVAEIWPKVSYLGLLARVETLPDEDLYRAILMTSEWSLLDRLSLLKLSSEFKGLRFLNTFITVHMAPIFTATLAGAEARLFFIHTIGIAVKSMKANESWSQIRNHLIEVLEAITSGIKLEQAEVFTDEEKKTATAVLAKQR